MTRGGASGINRTVSFYNTLKISRPVRGIFGLTLRYRLRRGVDIPHIFVPSIVSRDSSILFIARNGAKILPKSFGKH
jgi:hypothetical protein